MSGRHSGQSLDTAESDYDRDGERIRVYPARSHQSSGRHGEDAVPRTERSQGRHAAAAPARGDRRPSTTSRGSGRQGTPVVRHGPSSQTQPSLYPSSYSPPVNPNYMYTSNPSSRNESSLPHRQLEYSTPDNHSISSIMAPPPPPQIIDFRSRLSSLARGFVAINVSDYAGCEKFMKQNPAILDEEEDDLVKEAVAAMLVGKETYAACCVQQSLLLRNYKMLSSSKERKDYFTGLINKERQALRDLFIARDAVMTSIQPRVQNSSRRPATQDTELTSSLGVLSVDGPSDRHGSGQQGRHLHLPNQPNPDNNNSRVHGTGSDRRPTVSNASDAPTFYGPGGSLEALDERYHLRDDGNKFFTFGRVFATLWHSSTGISRNDKKRGDQVRPGRFGELIHSHIQRMAVVREDHGFCWCIPINTYNGKGVAKTGFNGRDIHAHAIIYMAGFPSEGAKGEPKMSKKPIEVNPAGPDQKLDPMSRIHFGKVHTVEHNVKVMNVGNITKKSLEYFEAYWNSKAEEENRRPK